MKLFRLSICVLAAVIVPISGYSQSQYGADDNSSPSYGPAIESGGQAEESPAEGAAQPQANPSREGEGWADRATGEAREELSQTNEEQMLGKANDHEVHITERWAACKVIGGTWQADDDYADDWTGASASCTKPASATAAAPATSPAAGDAEAGACNKAYESARRLCDPFGGEGVSDREKAAIEGAIQTGVGIGQQAASMGKGMHGMCSTAETISKIMSGVQSARAATCKTTQNMCLNTCKTEIDETNNSLAKLPQGSPAQAELSEKLRKLNQTRKRCNAFERQFAQQLQAALQYSAHMLGSKACADATRDPGLQASSGKPDCSIEAVKRTNMFCICESNPRDPRCGYNAGLGGTLGSATSGSLGSRADGETGLSSYGNPDDFGGNGLNDPRAAGAGNRAPSGGGGGGGGGGGPSLTGGGRGFDNNGSGGGGAARAASLIGGVGGAAGGGSGYGRPGGPAPSGGGGSSWMNKLKDKFNIKSALPSKAGLGGLTPGASADGVTGAMGPTIWEKATRQYRNQERTTGFLK